MSTLDHTLEPEAAEVRRLEVITGMGRRRQFSGDFKARVVEETLVAGAVISEVARRHGLTPQQVFTWRRQARRSEAGADAVPTFCRSTAMAAIGSSPSTAMSSCLLLVACPPALLRTRRDGLGADRQRGARAPRRSLSHRERDPRPQRRRADERPAGRRAGRSSRRSNRGCATNSA